MKTLFKMFTLVAACEFACFADGATATFDLRTPRRSAVARLRTASSDSCLQTATFPADVTQTGALSVGDTLDFLLFADTEITVTLTERMESPLVGEAFIGTASGYDGVKNAVVLQTAEGLTVDIQDFARSRAYTIVSDTDGVTVKEVDPSLNVVVPTEPVDPGIQTASLKTRQLSASSSTYTDPTGQDTSFTDQASTLVDILVAYDTPAAAWARQNGGGITNFATMAVQKMNTVLDNCGFASAFRYRLVGVMTVDAIGGTDLNGVLNATKDGTGDWASVKTMRDTVGADIVTTLIDTGSASGENGLGFSLKGITNYQSFSESAYNVCAVRAVANDHTMTHEVGHNIGAGHATEVNPDEISPGPQLFPYSAGYYFIGKEDNVKYHTIMAYNFDGYGNHYSPAPFFSSPNLYYKGTAVGDDLHDNVQTIEKTYLAASKWRAQKVPMSYDVYFSPEGGATFTDSITVMLRPGKTGLDIRYTLDGTMPTTSSTLYTEPIVLTQTTTIRAITVTDGNPGPVFEATYSISDLGNGLDAPQLNWATSPDYPWTFQTDIAYDGIDAARSALFNSGNESGPTWIKTMVVGPTTMSFRYMKKFYASSFTVTCDSTTLYSDTTSGAPTDWSLVEINIPPGSHEIKFSFRQVGYYTSSGGSYVFNGIWLDTIQFDALSRPPEISPSTTPDESTAHTFHGSETITITPPAERQGVLYYTTDGSDPNGEAQRVYDGPITITKSTRIRAVFVEGGKEPSAEVGGLYLERHPIPPGEWTTDVEGAKTAAAQNGRLIAVLLANRAGCWWSQQFYPIAESPEFLAWAEANGIYLVTCDTSCNVDAATAESWFWQLRSGYGESGSVGMPTIFFARPDAPTTAIGKGFARNDGSTDSAVGTVPYVGTVESLIAGFASVLVETVPQAPICVQNETLVDSFPLNVTLINPNATATAPNGGGTIYYTLDGSVPTPTNGTPYNGGEDTITISSSSDELRAAVWTGASFSSPMLIKKYITVSEWVNGIFGTSGIEWHRRGSVDWYQVGTEPTLRTGGLLGTVPYSSTITATVTGKGKMVYRYKAASWSGQNIIFHTVNGIPKWTVSANYNNIPTITVTNEVTDAGMTTFNWTYTVDDPSYDYTSRYYYGTISVWSGVWIYDLQWIPEKQTVDVEGVPVPYTWIDEYYPNQGGATTSYEMLANDDSDGDGFTTWQEFLLGTDPTNTESRLTATVRIEGGVPVFEWTPKNPDIDKIGYRYEKMGRWSLDDAAGWQPFTEGHRFFKVVVEPVTSTH